MAAILAEGLQAPNAAAWEEAGTIPRELWAEAAALGFGALTLS
ncbi:MAG: acyl-CoA dehydrogenase family protein, partial [Planctomycetota bacterium]